MLRIFNFKILTVNKTTYLSFFSKGNSIPSRNPRAANISPGFPSDSVEHRPEGDADDTTGTGTYANDKPSSKTPSRNTLNGIANRKGLLILCEILHVVLFNYLAILLFEGLWITDTDQDHSKGI